MSSGLLATAPLAPTLPFYPSQLVSGVNSIQLSAPHSQMPPHSCALHSRELTADGACSSQAEEIKRLKNKLMTAS